MADDKKNIPEAPAPEVENTAMPEQPAPEPALTDAEAVKQKPSTEKDKVAKPGRGRPPKDGKAAQTSGQKVPKQAHPGEACRG